MKAVAGLEKSDSGEYIELAGMTPGNTDYQKYDPPGAQKFCDAIAIGIFCALLPFSQNISRK